VLVLLACGAGRYVSRHPFGAARLQFHDIEKIAEHPVPWPYTHLTQFFLVIWVYSLPLCLVPTYGFAGMSGVFEATVESLLSTASLPMCARLPA
jgi:hypothetical protein